MIGTGQPWNDPDILQRRLRALGASQTELRALMGELATCPYRSGLLGAGAPVLPSPDELRYAANVIDRLATCVRHALVLCRSDELADG